MLIPSYLLNLMPEYLPTIILTEPSSSYDPTHTFRLEEYLCVTVHCILECFITWNLSFTLEKTLKINMNHCFTQMISTYIHFVPNSLQTFLGHLVVSLDHVVWLLGIEWVGNGAQYKHVQL